MTASSTWMSSVEDARGNDLHAYAERRRAEWLTHLDALPRPWHKGAGWENACVITASNLIRLANSAWSAYTPDDARADYFAHAPVAETWDQRERRWEQAAAQVAGTGLPEPPPFELHLEHDEAPELGEDYDREDEDDAGHPVSFRRSWRPVDLTDILEGRHEPAMPSVGARSDGVGLFYPGKVHTISSETEGGKTWFVLVAAAHEIRAGRSVVYIDFEDNEGGIVPRLVALGADPLDISARFHYLRPEDPVGTGIHADDLTGLLRDVRPSLGVIDGVTDALGLHGLDANSNADVAKFTRLLPRRITQAGAASVALDHLTKSTEGRGRYSIGGVHKLNGLDGAAYLLENRSPIGAGLSGKSTVRIAKDRPGQLRKHALPSAQNLPWMGDLIVDIDESGFAEGQIAAPAAKEDGFRPTVYMGRIMEAIEERGPLSKRMIRAAVKGKATTVDTALDALILDGYLTETTPHTRLKGWLELEASA